MVNLKAFKEVHKYYQPIDMPFLSELKEELSSNKPYDGLRVLQNIPLTIEAVLKIEPLVIAGADVTVSCVRVVPPNPKAIQILHDANIKVDLEHSFKEDFDICLDCCGEMANCIQPKNGASELTQTGSEIYKQISTSYPVVCVDDSKLKYLETLYGTGDGFTRALISLTNSEIYNKKFIVFGYGKVGSGIVNSLLKYTDEIIVVEKDVSLLNKALKKGLKAISNIDVQEIKHEILNIDCVVTATGVKGLLTENYRLCKDDFKNALLANMGAEDEFGDNFSIEDVLFNKKPLNFSISEPTTMKYLDPILYAHNISIDLILSNQLKPGYNPFPDNLAVSILRKWATKHHEDVKELLLEHEYQKLFSSI